MNITWSITQMDRLTSDGFVTTVHYNVSAVEPDGTDAIYTASTYGTIGFTPIVSEVGTPATPFESLTEAQVIAWVKDKLGEATVEASLAAQIEAQRNPVKASGLPW
jgi:hypothetical protein